MTTIYCLLRPVIEAVQTSQKTAPPPPPLPPAKKAPSPRTQRVIYVAAAKFSVIQLRSMKKHEQLQGDSQPTRYYSWFLRRRNTNAVTDIIHTF